MPNHPTFALVPTEVRATLWGKVLPDEAQVMLAQGLYLDHVLPLFADDLYPPLMQVQLLRAVTRARQPRSVAEVEAFCKRVEDHFLALQLSFIELHNGMTANPLPMQASIGMVAARVGEHVARDPEAAYPAREMHGAYNVISLMVPLATWWLLEDAGQTLQVNQYVNKYAITAGRMHAAIAAEFLVTLLAEDA